MLEKRGLTEAKSDRHIAYGAKIRYGWMAPEQGTDKSRNDARRTSWL